MADGSGIFNVLYQAIGYNSVVSANNRVSRSMNKVGFAARAMQASTRLASASMLGSVAGVAAVGMAIRGTIRAYASYSIAQSRIRTTLAAQTLNYRQNERVIRGYTEAVGRDLGYSLEETTDSMNKMLQTGLGIHKGMRIFRTGLMLARVADMDTGRATQFLTDAMSMFNKEMGRTGETARQFSRRMATQLSVAANMASTNIEQLQNAFNYAGTEMSNMGYTSGETMAALAGMSAMGIRGSSAGTRLRQAMAKLINPTRATMEAFKSLGGSGRDLTEELRLVVFNAAGGRRSLADTMGRLNELFRKLPTDQAKASAMFRLFGLRGASAGTALAGLSRAGDVTLDIMNRLKEEDVVSGSILDKQNEERMRSFGMQMQQLRHGVHDLAIAFGEILFEGIGTANKGFGTHVREVVSAIRLSGKLSDMTEEEKIQWERLSPAVREQGKELRELFVNVADIIKVLGTAAKWVIKLSVEYPRLTAAIIGLGIASKIGAFSGIVSLSNAMFTARTASTAMGVATTSTAAKLKSINTACNVVSLAVAGLGTYLVGKASVALMEFGIETAGLTDEYKLLKKSTLGQTAEMVKQIPVVGALASQYLLLVKVIQDSIIETMNFKERRAGVYETKVLGTAEEVVSARETRMRASTALMDVPREELRRRAIASEQQESMMRAASIFYVSGQRDIHSIAQELRRSGMGYERAREVATEVYNLQRTNSETVASDIRAMGVNMHNTGEAARSITSQLVQFERVTQDLGDISRDRPLVYEGGFEEVGVSGVAGSGIDQIMNETEAVFETHANNQRQRISQESSELQRLNSTMSTTFSGIENFVLNLDNITGDLNNNQSIPRVEDAYVNRGGIIRASSGDILVSGRELANVQAERSGAIASQIMGSDVGVNRIGPLSNVHSNEIPDTYDLRQTNIPRTFNIEHDLSRTPIGIENLEQPQSITSPEVDNNTSNVEISNLVSSIMSLRSSLLGLEHNTKNNPTGPQPMQDTSKEIVVPVSVNIDGREIARAVGREHVNHLERSGASFQPGQRRTMSESGFPERTG